VNSTKYKAHRCVNFSYVCLLPLASVEMLYLAICSHITYTYVKGQVSHLSLRGKRVSALYNGNYHWQTKLVSV
jgi:hypothetical protein